jgi:acetate kinase
MGSPRLKASSGTRCGSIDPGVLIYLMDERGLDAEAWKASFTRTGLLGVPDLVRHADSSPVG